MDFIILNLGTAFKGNCDVTGYVGQIECLSFSNSVALPLSGHISNTERTIGKPSFSEMVLSKYTDQATPAMFTAVVSGTPIPTATLVIGRNQGGAVMIQVQYTLTGVLISNLSTSGGGGGHPMDNFGLSFAGYTVEYVAQKADSTKEGTASGTWNLITNATS